MHFVDDHRHHNGRHHRLICWKFYIYIAETRTTRNRLSSDRPAVADDHSDIESKLDETERWPPDVAFSFVVFFFVCFQYRHQQSTAWQPVPPLQLLIMLPIKTIMMIEWIYGCWQTERPRIQTTADACHAGTGHVSTHKRLPPAAPTPIFSSFASTTTGDSSSSSFFFFAFLRTPPTPTLFFSAMKQM